MLRIVSFSAHKVFFIFLFAWCCVVLWCGILTMLNVQRVLIAVSFHISASSGKCVDNAVFGDSMTVV